MQLERRSPLEEFFPPLHPPTQSFPTPLRSQAPQRSLLDRLDAMDRVITALIEGREPEAQVMTEAQGEQSRSLPSSNLPSPRPRLYPHGHLHPPLLPPLRPPPPPPSANPFLPPSLPPSTRPPFPLRPRPTNARPASNSPNIILEPDPSQSLPQSPQEEEPPPP